MSEDQDQDQVPYHSLFEEKRSNIKNMVSDLVNKKPFMNDTDISKALGISAYYVRRAIRDLNLAPADGVTWYRNRKKYPYKLDLGEEKGLLKEEKKRMKFEFQQKLLKLQEEKNSFSGKLKEQYKQKIIELREQDPNISISKMCLQLKAPSHGYIKNILIDLELPLQPWKGAIIHETTRLACELRNKHPEKTLSSIAAEIGVTRERVRQVLVRHGLPTSIRPKKYFPIDALEKIAVLRAEDPDLTINQLLEKTGLSQAHVTRALKELGLERRRPGIQKALPIEKQRRFHFNISCNQEEYFVVKELVSKFDKSVSRTFVDLAKEKYESLNQGRQRVRITL